jgi:hypothetical protein
MRADDEEPSERQEEDAIFNRRLKYAVIAYAIIEFAVLALIIYYKVVTKPRGN